MAGKPGQVIIHILGDSKGLGKALDGADSKLGKFAKGAGKAFLAVGAAGAAIVGGLAKIGHTFDNARDAIIVGTGASGEALDGLEQSFKDVFSSTATTTEDASAAIADLNTRLGLTGEPLERLSKKMLDLSRMTKTDVSQNIANVTRVFGDWSIATEEQEGALDKIFEATKRTGIGLDRLTTLTVQYGAPMRQLGFSFEESISLFAKFEKEGVNVETVMSGMRQGLSRMARAGEEPIETFARIQEEIKGAGTAGEANAIALEAFGARAGPDMAAAIREGRFELGDMVDGLMNSEGAIEDATKRTEDFAEKWTIFKNKVLTAIAPLAERVFGALGSMMDAVAPKLDQVVNLISAFVEGDLWGIAEVLDNLFGGNTGAAVQPILGFFTTIGEGVGTARGFFDQLKALWAQVSETFAAHADEIRATFSSVLERVGSAMESIRSIISGVLAIVSRLWELWGDEILTIVLTIFRTAWRVIDEVLRAISGVIDLVLGIITGDWSRAWAGIKNIFGGVWEAIKGILSGALGIVKSLLSAAWDTIFAVASGALGSLVGAVSEKIGEVVGWVAGLPGRLLSALGNLGSLLKSAGRAVLQGLWDGLKEKWEAVKDWVGGLGSKIRNLKGPIEKDRVLLTGEGSAIMEGLGKGLATGWEDVRDTIAHVTSEIPRLAADGAQGTGRTGQGMAPAVELQTREGGDGRSIEINVHGVVGDKRELAAWLREEIRKLDREDA